MLEVFMRKIEYALQRKLMEFEIHSYYLLDKLCISLGVIVAAVGAYTLVAGLFLMDRTDLIDEFVNIFEEDTWI